MDHVPQLIRHVQVLYQAMVKAGTRAYVKIGTSGTGGMGLNIPYTHSEEKPSRVLLSKSALAGAHSLLLFLMARTPGGPITKEIKPAAAIAWKRIGYGEVLRRGRPVGLHAADPVDAEHLQPGTRFRPQDPERSRPLGRNLESVFIDTGENGIFSLEEFAAITTSEQMEFVTPEEIADVVAHELVGGNTGHDIINALDNAVMGPTYRAGLMRHWALEKLRELEKKHDVRSVAFENLGPPRLSKLLFEADILRRTFGTMSVVRDASPAEMSVRTLEELGTDDEYRSQIVSIGIPILLPEGALLRGPGVQDPRGHRSRPDVRGHPRGHRGLGPRGLGGPAGREHGALEGALRAHRVRDRRHPPRRVLLPLPPRPAVLERGGAHPAREGRGLDLRHRGEGRADEMK